MKLKLNTQSILIRGTVQLAAAGIFTRILGLGNRMVLSRFIGAEGLGLFQMILPVYALLAVIAGLGLPGAVTKIVADRHARGDLKSQLQVRGIALKYVFAASLAGAALLWIALSLPLDFIPDRRIVPSLRLMPAAFLFAALSSVLRSYSQGRSNMAPTALSQVAEQSIRVALGLAAAIYLLPLGLDYALIGIMLGIIAGEIACCGVLFFLTPDKKTLRPPGKAAPALLREICLLSLPILAIRLSTSVTQTVESLMIPYRLQAAGYSAAQATTLFGQLLGMALPLLFLPTVLIIPLNTTLVPAIAGAVTLRLKRRLRRLLNLSLCGTIAVGAASAAILFYFAPPLTQALYGSDAAAYLVAFLAPVAPFAYLQFVTAAILHGMGRPGIAVANDLAGTVISLILIYYLTALPGWGIKGVICGYTVAFTLIAILDCLFIYLLSRRI
jgi:stage V sporulation protein B